MTLGISSSPTTRLARFGYELNVSKIGLTNMGFGPDIHVLLRVNYKNLGEPKVHSSIKIVNMLNIMSAKH